jgi:hypothetical protein
VKPADTFDLKRFLTEGQLEKNLQEVDEKEQAVVNDVKDEMDSLLKGIENEFEKASETTNESLLTVASIAVALPAIMNLISKIGTVMGRSVTKILGKKPSDESGYQQWMIKLSHIADDLHHLYITPLESLTKKFIKDPKKAHTVASAIWHVIVATLLLSSGQTAVKALQSKNISLATLESALSAIKTGELSQFFQDILNKA